VTYAFGIANSIRQNNDVLTRRPRPELPRMENVPSSVAKTPSHSARKHVLAEEAKKEKELEEMFAASRKEFLAIANSVLRNRDDAEDAVQDAFFSAFQHLRSFEGRCALRSWLIRIVMNAALMAQRKRKPMAVRSLSDIGTSHDEDWTQNIPDLQPNAEAIHADHEILDFVEEILGTIKPALRQAFTMTYFKELSIAESSVALGVPFATFKTRLHRARYQVFGQTRRVIVARSTEKRVALLFRLGPANDPLAAQVLVASSCKTM
jgi:RNA polymerase sigma factor (sigma-70 family)